MCLPRTRACRLAPSMTVTVVGRDMDQCVQSGHDGRGGGGPDNPRHAPATGQRLDWAAKNFEGLAYPPRRHVPLHVVARENSVSE